MHLPVVRGELTFDSIRVYLNENLHIDIRRSTYRGLQAWKWDGNFKVEFSLAGAQPMLIEYTNEKLWLSVIAELEKLALNGD